MTNEWGWVAASYGLTWVVLAVYLRLLAQRAARTRGELLELRETMNESGPFEERAGS